MALIPAHFIKDWMVTTEGNAAIACNCGEGFIGPSLAVVSNLHGNHCQGENQQAYRKDE